MDSAVSARVHIPLFLSRKVKPKLRVASYKFKYKSTDSNPQVASSNLRVTSLNLRVTISNLRIISSNQRVMSSNQRVTS